MMLGTSILRTIAVAAQVLAVLGTPIQSRTAYAVKGKHPVPRPWTQRGRAPSSQMLHLQIGVKQSQFDELERQLYEGTCLFVPGGLQF
jgi:tripeptidyl-peptidase-1